MNSSPYTIRRARADDVDRLAELVLALQDHLEASNPGVWQMTDDARRRVRNQVASRVRAVKTWVLVAEHDVDGIVGVIFGRTATYSRYTPPRTGVVDQAYVQPEHRRRGIATRLVSELCRAFAIEGVPDVSLRFVSGNREAASFWASLGFAPRILTVGAGLDEIQSRVNHFLTP